MASDDKNPPQFTADISEEAIEEALRAVERQADRAATEDREASGAALEPEEWAVDVGIEAGDDDAAAEEIAALRQEVSELAAKIRQKDKLLEMLAQQGREATAQARQAREWLVRQAADHESHKKRVERERKDVERYAVEKLVVDLLPVFDALDRAVLHASRSEEGVAEGVSMVRQQFVDVLAAYGARPYRALGERFDPKLHEAVHVVRDEEREANSVVEELACGFRLHDRIVRPAKVTVALPPDAEGERSREEEQGAT